LVSIPKKQKIALAVGVVFAVAAFGAFLLNARRPPTEEFYVESNTETPAPSEPEASLEPSPSPEAEKKILVHLKGAVKKEGMYELAEGARLNALVELAGGLLENADLLNVNLASTLTDGDEIYIPPKGDKTGKAALSHEAPAAPAAAEKPASNGTSASSAASERSAPEKVKPGETVNINDADVETLCRLPGVGEATARKIIDFRAGRAFEVIEDIQRVSGIGAKKFADMKPYIVVK
jgi:competence protein ComEA